MDAQHQKTNKSAQFACYLREHTYIIEYYILHLSFRAAVPPLYPFVPLPIQRIQAGLPGKQASNKRGRKFLGTTFFCFFFGHGNKRIRQELPTYLPALPYHEPATANRRTVNCATWKPTHYV